MFFKHDEQLEQLGNGILEATLAQFSTLARNQIALTWIIYDPPGTCKYWWCFNSQRFLESFSTWF